MESAIAKQGSTEVSYAHQSDSPLAISAQDFADGPDQLITAVADAWVAKVTKMGQVFANLGVSETEPLSLPSPIRYCSSRRYMLSRFTTAAGTAEGS